ncbi:MAG: adenosine deaminase [Candidatus Eisenbacteria bacterium]
MSGGRPDPLPEPDLAPYEALPKAELHIHLEGAIPLDTLGELIRKYGGDPSVSDRRSLESRFTYRDFPHFIDTWVWKNGFLREAEDFTHIAEGAARDLAARNVRYGEVIFSPSDFFRHGLDTGTITEAIRIGLARVKEIEVALVADLVRDRGPENGTRILRELAELKEYGVVGITIGGSEHEFPPEPFAGVFEEARRGGFRTSAHAGEAAGPESVWGAVRALRVDRIGHGTRAAEDDALVDHLAAEGIPVELCPLSNVRTGVVPSIADHPARRFYDRGIPVSVSTDDPKMFQTSLPLEYALLARDLGFTPPEIGRVVLGALRSSWLPDDRKLLMEKEFTSNPAWAPFRS